MHLSTPHTQKLHCNPPNGSIESVKLLALPPLQHITDRASTITQLRLTLTLSYSTLLLVSSTYLCISGYASFWRSSAYIGAISGLNTVFFSAVLLIASAKTLHPLAEPHSASLRARVYATLLAGCWTISTAFVVAYTAANATSQWRGWVVAELTTSVLAFCCTLLVMALQFAQHSRYIAARGSTKRAVKYRCLLKSQDAAQTKSDGTNVKESAV